MKRSFLLAGLALMVSCSFLNAQQTETPTDTMPAESSNPTVSDITSKYQLKEMPAALSVDKVFPIAGSFQSNNGTDVVKVTLDENKKGTIWIEGLPQGKVRAILLKMPSTYKIPAQKTEEGTDVEEGTLIFNKDDNSLNICLGKKFDYANPGSAFAETMDQPAELAKNTKTKKPVIKEKTWKFSGVKQEAMTTASAGGQM